MSRLESESGVLKTRKGAVMYNSRDIKRSVSVFMVFILLGVGYVEFRAVQAYFVGKKEVNYCQAIADTLFYHCENYRLAKGFPPTNLQAVLPDGRTIYQAVYASIGEDIVRIKFIVSEDNTTIMWNGNEIVLANVSAMGMDGYDVYIKWHLTTDFKVAHYYHPWDNV